jgi:flagellar basal body-associated protein FliL
MFVVCIKYCGIWCEGFLQDTARFRARIIIIIIIIIILLLLYLLTVIGLSPGGSTQSHTNNT